MNYLELSIEKKHISELDLEILVAEMAHYGFERLTDERESINAYIPLFGSDQVKFIRKIPLDCIPEYSSLLNIGGTLLVSGIVKEDQPVIIETTRKNNLDYKHSLSEANWISIKFRK